jgi:exonuclease VII small subunit
MADWFRADLAVLGELVSGLEQIGENLQAAFAAMAGEQSLELGTGELNKAADKFQQGWSHGLKQLRESTGEMAATVGKARAAYQQADDGADRMAKALGSTS